MEEPKSELFVMVLTKNGERVIKMGTIEHLKRHAKNWTGETTSLPIPANKVVPAGEFLRPGIDRLLEWLKGSHIALL